MTVFILGAGPMQIPAISIAHELGWTVIAADANDKAPGAALADRFVHVDLKDREGLAEAALELRASMGLDGVFTAGTDFSASVAWVAERLGLPGISHETALRASDKLRMRAALEAAGVPSPRYAAVDKFDDASKLLGGLDFPLVVKPADNMGARGCRLARDKAELRAALAAALPFSASGRAIVEEYIEGPEFSIDAIVYKGEIRIRGIADRHIYFSPYFVELGHTMPSSASETIREEVLRVFRLGVAAIGIDLGAAKGDIKYCPARGLAMVGEIAARLSGGYMSGWTYPYASGIEVTREALEIAVGLSPSAQAPDRGCVSAERAFISIPGEASVGIGLRRIQALAFVKDMPLRFSPGDMMVFPSNNVEKCGNVITLAPMREDAIAAADTAVRSFLLRLAPRDAATEAFLRGERGLCGPAGPEWPPEAFALEPGIRAQLDAMPEYAEVSELADSLAVLAFDAASEAAARDWSGRGFMESALLALQIAGAIFYKARVDGVDGLAWGNARHGQPRGGRILAGRFWRALARGGAQAALYALDCEEGRGA